MSELLNWLKDNYTTKEQLKEDMSNMFIDVKFEGDLALFKYNMLKTKVNDDGSVARLDWSIPLQKECRGHIVNLKYMTFVCRPFDKFFNYGESNADVIDWKTAKVQEKIDGSLIKAYYYGEWRFATQGMFHADELFTQQIKAALANSGIRMDLMSPFCTYLFELVSPKTQVVVHYDKPKLYHLSCRDNATGEEYDRNLNVEKPKYYSLGNLDDVIAAAKELNKTDTVEHEGFVVKDKNNKRVKVKDPAYVAVHKMATQKVSKDLVVERVINNDVDELLLYQPRLVNTVDYLKNLYEELLKAHDECARHLESCPDESKKEYAMWVKQMQPTKPRWFSALAFGRPNEETYKRLLKTNYPN
jgi:T4 RnlA family RNA ligase